LPYCLPADACDPLDGLHDPGIDLHSGID